MWNAHVVFNANNSNDVDHIANNNNDIDHIANNDEDIDRIANHNAIKSVDIILGPKLRRQREHTLNISSGYNSNLNCVHERPDRNHDDNAALIGGIVGGAVALLLIGALIAVCVVRSRRQPKGNNAGALHSVHSTTTPPKSNYGHVPPAQSNYSERAPIPATRSHYDALNASEL